MNSLLFVLLAVIGIGGWYAFDRQRRIYEQIIDLLTRDRDAARNEAQVFRGLLFPAIGKIEQAALPKQAPRQTSPLNPIQARQPWRIRVKHLMQQHNTQQVSRDQLAATIQKAEESKNA